MVNPQLDMTKLSLNRGGLLIEVKCMLQLGNDKVVFE